MQEEILAFLRERYELSREKIYNIVTEGYGDELIRAYFVEMADFLCRVDAFYQFIQNQGDGEICAEEQRRRMENLHEEILPENYATSYANPAYAAEQLGAKFGRLLSALYAEVRSVIIPLVEKRLEELLIRMELFVEVYSAFEYEWLEGHVWPAYESIQQIFYWYVSDYSEITADAEVKRFLALEETKNCKTVEAFCGSFEYPLGLLQGLMPARNAAVSISVYSDSCYHEDHKKDKELLWDKAMVKRRLEVLRTALEKHREQLSLEQKKLSEEWCQSVEVAEKQYLHNC